MKKYKFLLTLITASILILTSCDSSQSSSRESLENSSETTISEQSSSSSKNEIVRLQSVTCGLKELTPRHFIYNGEPIKMPFVYASVGSNNFGLMVLCNGIAVPFTTAKTTGNEKLHIMPTLPNGEEDNIEISFTPTGKTGDTTQIQLISIVEPDFDLNSMEKISSTNEYDYNAFRYGQKFNVIYNSEITVEMKADGIKQTDDIDSNYKKTPLTQEEIDEYIIVEENGQVHNNLENLNRKSLINNKNNTYIVIKKGEKIDFSIEYTGTDGFDISTSIYLNNKIYPAFNGKNYNICHSDKDNKTNIQAVIDTADFEVGLYSCYGVLGIAKESTLDAFPPFFIEIVS